MILFKFMRPRKRDFRGDARKGAKNYGIVSSDDSEVYRRKDPFAGWHPYRWAQLKRVRKFAQSANLMSRTKAIVGKEANIKNKVRAGKEKVVLLESVVAPVADVAEFVENILSGIPSFKYFSRADRAASITAARNGLTR